MRWRAKLFDLARPDPRNQWAALFTAALYGVHPANAETVNYVIQRGDLYSTLGVVAAVVIYAYSPRLSAWGIYLLPFVAGVLSKPPALIFPAILFVYIRLFEEENTWRAAARTIPALVVAAGLGVLTSVMNSKSLDPGPLPVSAYRLTQPLVALRYFRTFFLPLHLTADSDFHPISGFFRDGAWLGFVFLAALIAVAVKCSMRREWRPVAFGLYWYLLALLPTSSSRLPTSRMTTACSFRLSVW